MVTKNNFLAKLLLASFILSFFGCTKDLYEENIQQNENKNLVVKQHVSIKDLKKSIASKINEKAALITGKKNSESKFEYYDAYGVYIDLEDGTLIECDGKYFFTFPMFEKDEENLENILFVIDENTEETDAILIKYNITPEEFKELPAGQINTLTPDYEKIWYSANPAGGPVCMTIQYYQEHYPLCPNPDGYHPETGLYCQPTVTIITSTYCTAPVNPWSDDTMGTGAGENGPTTPPTGSYNGSSGGHGSVYTSPKGLSPQQLAFKKFNLGLSADQRAWLLAHESVRTSINNYLNNQLATQDGNYEAGVTDFVYQFIQNSIVTGLDFNFEKSVKSPAFIDFSSVSGNTPQEVNFRAAYNSLTTSPLFRDLFVNLFGQSPLFGVKFQIVDIPQTGQGYITGQCTMTTLPGMLNPFNTIQIDRNYLLTKSKADIVRTILHECIHAYLNIKLRNPTIGMSISAINNLDFQACINLYYSNFSGNQDQHSFFTTFMIPTMIQILQDIRNDIFTPAQIQALENPTNPWAILYSPEIGTMPLEPSTNQIPWNWHDFFYYFCHNGLQNCTAYPFSLYPNLLNNQDYYNFHYMMAFNVICNP